MSQLKAIMESTSLVVNSFQLTISHLIQDIPVGFFQTLNENFEMLELGYRISKHDILGTLFCFEDQCLNLFDRYKPGEKGLYNCKIASVETVINCVADLGTIEEIVNSTIEALESRLSTAQKTIKTHNL